ncbi:RNA polymerase sigma factor [Mangrovibacterium sp.]|uniref:RNA polymerase sigma factor n=1 Tax=Mangrovibacterium sp. TaxID=1961364 RepID=UPI0035665090
MKNSVKKKKEGISVKEIASQLNISPKTVENHLTEALKNLKRGLGEEDIALILFFSLFVSR